MEPQLINVSIDLTKIDKNKIKDHANGGKYYNLVVATRQQPDNYGNTHTVYERSTEEEQRAGKARNYLGNGKVVTFMNNTPATDQPAPPADGSADDDLPF